jgi:2-polyprenyl-6-methoxyphenol hydroxylase-like FAD-dependent oxidoreductase
VIDQHRAAPGSRPASRRDAADSVRPADPLAAERPYVVWSVAARLDSTGSDLIGLTHRLTKGWSDDFHALVDRSEAGSVAAFPFYFPAALKPWPAGRVTLLGDAIHPMPPTAGTGASTAILDAAHLADDLGTRQWTRHWRRTRRGS